MFYVSDRLSSNIYRVVNSLDWSICLKTKDDIIKDVDSGLKYLGMNCGKRTIVDGEIPVSFVGDVLDFFYSKCALSGGDCGSEDRGFYTERHFSLVTNGIGFNIRYKDYTTIFADGLVADYRSSEEFSAGICFSDYSITLDSVFFVSVPRTSVVRLPDFITDFGDTLSRDDVSAFSRLNDKMLRKDIALTLPNRLRTLTYGAFDGCDYIKSVSIGVYLRSIPRFCFAHCSNLNTVYFRADTSRHVPSDLQDRLSLAIRIEDNAFLGSGISTISIPYFVSSIGQRAFYDCTRLRTISSSGLGVVGSEAFRGCSSLENINTISSMDLGGLHFIGDSAFVDCDKLSAIYLSSDVEVTVADDVFNGCSSLGCVHLVSDVTQLGLSKALECSGLPKSVLYVEQYTPF